MPKLAAKIAAPIIIATIFAILVIFSVDYKKLDVGFYLMVFMLVIFVFFFGLSIGQQFSSPIKQLISKANEIIQGDLSGRIYLQTKDELVELADAFNRLAEELQKSRDQEINAERLINVKVQARTKELEETIYALEQKVRNKTIELERLLAELNKQKQKQEIENKSNP